jgi:hypothetical protein
MTPSKHIQDSQDAAIMNASRGGIAPTASRNRQIGKRGAGGEAWWAR